MKKNKKNIDNQKENHGKIKKCIDNQRSCENKKLN